MNTYPLASRNENSSHDPRRQPSLMPHLLSALLALAALVAGAATAQASPPDTPSTPALVDADPIAQVDVYAETLRDQPNMHGIGVITGPDGQPRMYCVDPSEHNPALRLYQQLQSGADSVRYQ